MSIMSKPESITIGDIDYYSASELEVYDSIYFVACKKTVRQIISNKNISVDNVAYGNYNKKHG